MGPKKATKRAIADASAEENAAAGEMNAAGDAPVQPAVNNEKNDGEASPAKRGRGRPKKPESERKTVPFVPSGKPRGRPKKVGTQPKKAEDAKPDAKVEVGKPKKTEDAKPDDAKPDTGKAETNASPVKRGRGRPPKAK